MSQKSYDNTPTLYLVPTPIGNMDDFTFRGVEILKNADVIFCEDTRVTINLLRHYNIEKHLISAHKFNEEKSVIKMLEYLDNNKNIALVSDRGTPVLSDPGNICVAKISEKGYNVVALPGATAAIPALTASGLDASRFLFYGFLNSKSSKRKKELELLRKEQNTIIFYEAPHRIIDTLSDMLEILGDRFISISREISKKYEEVYRDKISKIIEELTEVKGEFVIVVSGNNEVAKYSEMTIKEHINLYREDGMDEKEAIKLVAKERGIPKSVVYSEVKLFPGK